MAKVKKTKFAFIFSILENGQEKEKKTVEALGNTEAEAIENATAQLSKVEWRYTGSFKNLGEVEVDESKKEKE